MDYKVIITKKEYDDLQRIKKEFQKVLDDTTYSFIDNEHQGTYFYRISYHFYSKNDAVKELTKKYKEVEKEIESIKSKWYYKLFTKS